MSRASRLRSSRIALRRSSSRLCSVKPALMQRQRRLTRDRFEQHDAPPLGPAFGGVRTGERQPSERASAEDERSDDDRLHARAAVEFPNRLGQARIVAAVLDALGPSRRVARRDGSPCSRAARPSASQSALVRVYSRSRRSHPQVAPLLVLVDQPDAAPVALALFDQRLREHAEEALDVGLAHQQIERELDDLGLHLRDALGATTLGGLANQRGAKHLRIAFFRVHGARLCHPRSTAELLPLVDYPAIRPMAASSKSRRSVSPEVAGSTGAQVPSVSCGSCPIVQRAHARTTVGSAES